MPFYSRRLASQGLLFLMASSLVAVTSAIPFRGEAIYARLGLLTVGFGMLGMAYVIVAASINKTGFEHERKYLWGAAGLQFAAVLVLWSAWLRRPDGVYENDIPKTAICLSLLAVAAYFKFHAFVYPELAIVRRDPARMHLLPIVGAIGVAVLFFFRTPREITTVIWLGVYLLLFPVVVLAMLIEVRKLPASLSAPEVEAFWFRIFGGMKVLLGLLLACSCLYAVIGSWRQWNAPGEAALMSAIAAVVGAIGLRWVATGSFDMFGHRLTFLKSLGVATLLGGACWVFVIVTGPLISGYQKQSSTDPSISEQSTSSETEANHPDELLRGHFSMITFSPDGTRVATLTPNRSIVIWDQSSRKPLQTIEASVTHGDLQFSPDGQWIVSSARPNSVIQFWNSEDLNLGFNLLCGDRVSRFAISADSKVLVSAEGRRPSIARIFDVGTRNRRDLYQSAEEITSLAMSPTTPQVAIGTWGNKVYVTSTLEGAEVKEFAPDANRSSIGSVDHLIFSPDGKQLYIAFSSGPVHVYEVDRPQQPATFCDYRGGIRSLALSPDGRTIAASEMGDSTTVDLFDASSHKKIRSFKVGGTQPIHNVTFDRSGKRVALILSDMTLRIHDVETGKAIERN